jgi:hypothetical protein
MRVEVPEGCDEKKGNERKGRDPVVCEEERKEYSSES